VGQGLCGEQNLREACDLWICGQDVTTVITMQGSGDHPPTATHEDGRSVFFLQAMVTEAEAPSNCAGKRAKRRAASAAGSLGRQLSLRSRSGSRF
jgi:hypothetical protein